MARRNRTAEILAAARLVPAEIAREQEQTRRASATSQALASLVPALIQGGVDIYGGVTKAQREDALQTKKDERADKDALADIAAQKATTDAQKARADAMKARAEADKVKATTDAAEATRKAEGESSKTTSEQSMAALRAAAAAPGAKLETLIGRASVDPGLGNLDDTAVSGIFAEEQAKARKEGAGAKLAERKAAAPLGPKPKSPEEIERQRKKDELLDEQLKQLRGKPEVAAQAEARDAAKLTTSQQEDVANITASRRALKRIADEAAKVDPNLLAAAKNAALNAVGIDDNLTNYVAEIRNFNSAVGAMRSGASIGVAEQKRLDSFLVAPQDTIGTVEQKRRAFEQYLQDKEAGINAARRAQNLPEANLSEPSTSKAIEQMTEEEVDARIKEIEAKR